jgi:hypothetical protein
MRHLIDRAAAGDFDPEVCQWIAKALSDYQRGRGSLADCLGLSIQARRKAAFKMVIEAAEMIREESPCASYWHTAGEIATAIKRLESRMTNRKNLPPLYQKLADAFAIGVRLPRSQKRLFDLIRDGQEIE